jgi:hypothetical protein
MNHFIEKHDMNIIIDALDVYITSLEASSNIVNHSSIINSIEDAKNLRITLLKEADANES